MLLVVFLTKLHFSHIFLKTNRYIKKMFLNECGTIILTINIIQDKDYFKYNRYMLSPFSKNLFLLSGYIGAVEVRATVRS